VQRRRDIIKSTDSAVAAEFKTRIVAVLDSFKERAKIDYDTSGNNAFEACAPDPVVLWDIAKALAIDGRSARKLGDTFGGTLKGLSWGSVAVQLKSDGRVIVKDSSISIPHQLPRAVGILAGADRCAGMGGVEPNDMLVMEAGAASRQFEAKHLKGQGSSSVLSHFDPEILRG
jgi:hypothetical protein